MVFITGDTHGDFSRFYKKKFPDQRWTTKDDIVIICGDFGFWDNSRKQDKLFDWLDKKPFTTVFVDGNHENFDLLYNLPVVKFHGGAAHKIRDSIYHLMRGEIFDFEGKKFLAMGGAESHDITDGILEPDDPMFQDKYNSMKQNGAQFRINHISWWEQETPNSWEMNHCIESLAECDWTVDYVISHAGPAPIIPENIPRDSLDRTVEFLNYLNQRLKFKEWHCGHYHIKSNINNKYYCHYQDIMRLF